MFKGGREGGRRVGVGERPFSPFLVLGCKSKRLE